MEMEPHLETVVVAAVVVVVVVAAVVADHWWLVETVENSPGAAILRDQNANQNNHKDQIDYQF